MIGKSQELKENEMHKAFKFRLLPTKEQEVLLAKHFGCVRFVYNHFLSEKQKHYLENETTLKFNECQNMLIKQKKDEGYTWLTEVNAQSLVSALFNLEKSYTNFFRKQCKFPKYKSKKNKNSFNVPQGIIFKKNNLVQIPKFKEGIIFNKHRELKGKIKSATISKNPSGKYYISFLSVVEKPNNYKKTGKKIGIDLGLKDFIVTSDGSRYSNPKFLKKNEIKLKRKQRHFSRKQKDSKRKEKQRLKVAKLYEKITNSRNNQHHQISSFLVKNYDVIALESLNVKGMMANHKLAQAIADVAWSGFVSKLEYKAKWYGKEVIRIETFFPSSKTCSCCGHQKSDLSLNDREWTCSSCNTIHDRDVNAAKNILQRGITIQSSGTDDYRHGVKVRPKTTKLVVKGIDCEVSKKKGKKYTLKTVGL